MRKEFCSIVFTVLLSLAAFAQTEPIFRVKVSQDSVLFGNPIEVRFTLEQGRGKNFQPPSFSGFDVVGGPNQSSNFSMINGEVKQSMTFSYFIEPREIGNYYIEPASIEVEGKIFETQPLQIMVVPNPDRIVTQPQIKDAFQRDPIFKEEFDPALESPKKKRKTYRL